MRQSYNINLVKNKTILVLYSMTVFYVDELSKFCYELFEVIHSTVYDYNKVRTCARYVYKMKGVYGLNLVYLLILDDTCYSTCELSGECL